MERQMLRAALRNLEEMGSLMVCQREVDPRYELGAIIDYFRGTRPILFKRIKGWNIPVVGGLFGDREIFYKSLGVTRKDRIFKFMNAIAEPMPARLLDFGPVMENIKTSGIAIERMFPIPTFHEKDSAPFITAGIVVVKDPETGNRYTSVRRLQVIGGNRISILIESPMLMNQMKEFESSNKSLEVAIVLGYDYPFILASQVKSETFGVDKYEIDSALRGEPLELVKCKTIDLEVPAHAEIVIEGIIPPHKRYDEGPFGEMAGYYGPKSSQPYVEITCIMHRNNPIFQTNFPSSFEHVLPNGLMREVMLYSSLKNMVDVRDVHLTSISGCRFHAFVSINKKSEGDGKSAIIAALASNKDVKHVVVVDEDVDIFKKDDVEWAIATRVQASKDVVIIPGALGSPLEPSHNMRGITDKMGIDATAPLGLDRERFERTRIPGFESIDISRYFTDLT